MKGAPFGVADSRATRTVVQYTVVGSLLARAQVLGCARESATGVGDARSARRPVPGYRTGRQERVLKDRNEIIRAPRIQYSVERDVYSVSTHMPTSNMRGSRFDIRPCSRFVRAFPISRALYAI